MSHEHHYRTESLFAVIEVKLPVLLTVKEAAIYLRVSEWTIRRWIAANLLEHVRIGRAYRIAPSSLPKFPVVAVKKDEKTALK